MANLARVLHVLDASTKVSGVVTHVRGLIELQRERGFDVQAMVLVDSTETPLPDFAAERFPRTFDHLQGWRLRNTLQRHLARFNPALIHLHAGFTTISPALVRTFGRFAPTVGTLHDVRPFCFRADRLKQPEASECTRRCGWGCVTSGCYSPSSPVELLKRLRTIPTGVAALAAWRDLAEIIVPSHYMEVLALQHGFAPQSLSLVPNFTEVVERSSFRSSAGDPLIVFMGRFNNEKGVLVLLDALKRIESQAWNAVLLGDGPLRAALIAQATQYGLSERLTILPSADSDQRSALLARAYMLVFPSLIPESFGLSGLEASAHGLPVISFGLGGVTEWLRDEGTGLIARPVHADALAQQMVRLLEAPEFARRLGHNGQELVRRDFNGTTAIERLSQIYNKHMRTPCG